MDGGTTPLQMAAYHGRSEQGFQAESAILATARIWMDSSWKNSLWAVYFEISLVRSAEQLTERQCRLNAFEKLLGADHRLL